VPYSTPEDVNRAVSAAVESFKASVRMKALSEVARGLKSLGKKRAGRLKKLQSLS